MCLKHQLSLWELAEGDEFDEHYGYGPPQAGFPKIQCGKIDIPIKTDMKSRFDPAHWPEPMGLQGEADYGYGPEYGPEGGYGYEDYGGHGAHVALRQQVIPLGC